MFTRNDHYLMFWLCGFGFIVRDLRYWPLVENDKKRWGAFAIGHWRIAFLHFAIHIDAIERGWALDNGKCEALDVEFDTIELTATKLERMRYEPCSNIFTAKN